MPPRVGSALDHVAAAIVALAVFALPASLAALATGHHEPWLLVGFPPALALALAAVVRLVAGPGWPSMIAAIIAAGTLTWLGALFAFLIGYSIKIDHSLCGGGSTSGAIASLGGIAVYAIVGSWAFTGSGLRFFLGPAAGAALAIAWALVALAVVPGGHGYCET